MAVPAVLRQLRVAADDRAPSGRDRPGEPPWAPVTEPFAALQRSWRDALEAALAAGQTPVLFTSRGEAVCASADERRRLGLTLAALMARLAADLAPRLYALLRAAEAAGVATLVVEGVPAEGIGRAVMDRLRRAAQG